MHIDASIAASLPTVAAQARQAEASGYDAVWMGETARDPLLALALAAEHTTGIGLGTSVTIAFARSPMTLAQTAWELSAYSRGRFVLGLGTQIRPHIEKRFSMPWSDPTARMREFIAATRAIWECWQNGTALNFQGDFYSHTLMTPFFNPGPNEFGLPRIFLAAVGEGMTRVAAEVADGILVHGFVTERYLRSITLPTVEAALAASGRRRSDFQVVYPPFVVTGDTEEQIAAAITDIRRQIAFYGSTPAYRRVLELHGWGDLQPPLHALSKRGEWDEMGRLIDDEVLNAFAVVGPPETVSALLRARFGDAVDRLRLNARRGTAPRFAAHILASLKARD